MGHFVTTSGAGFLAYIQPDTPEMKIRICEKRDHSIDVSGSTEKTNNTIIEGYNH